MQQLIQFIHFIYDSFWTHDPSSQYFILFMLAIAAVALIFLVRPLEMRLRNLRKLRSQAWTVCKAESARDGKELAVRRVFEKSLLAPQWHEFSRRWSDARGQVLHDRAPVRFIDVLRRRSLLPEFRGQSLLPALPGVLLGLGILGTFLGLTQALPHAGTSFVSEPTSVTSGTTLSPTGRAQERIDQQIDGMTKALALAFKTSLWGLTLSMFLTLLLRRLDGAFAQEENELDRVVHAAFEWVGPDELSALALHEQTEAFGVLRTEFSNLSVDLSNVLGQGIERMQASAADTAEAARREQAEALGKIATDLSSILEQGLGNIARSSADAATLVTNEQRDALRQIVSEIGEKLREGVGEQVSALVEAVESARKSQAEVSGAIAQALSQIETSSVRHAALLERIDSTAETLASVGEKTIDGARAVESALVHLTEAGSALRDSATAASAVQEASRQGLTSLQQVLQDSRAIVEEQRRLAESSMGELQSALKAMSEGLGDSLLSALREVDGVLAKAVQRVAGTTAETGDILERLGEPIASLDERFAALSISVGTIGQAIDRLGSELGNHLRSVDEALARMGDRIHAATDVLGEGLVSRLAPTREALVNASRAMETSVARFALDLSERSAAFEQAIERGSERVSDGADRMTAELSRVSTVLGGLHGALVEQRAHVLDGSWIVQRDQSERLITVDEPGAPPSCDAIVTVGLDESRRLPAEAAPEAASSARSSTATDTVNTTAASAIRTTEPPGERPSRFRGIFGGRR